MKLKKGMTAQDAWSKKHLKNLRAWICKCGRGAFLHTCIKGKHRFWCEICVDKYLKTYGY